MKKFKWQYKFKYLLHLFLILLTLFLSYPVGDWILKFDEKYATIKMFVWFGIFLFLSDNVWENITGV